MDAPGPWTKLVDVAPSHDALEHGHRAPRLIILDCRHALDDPDAGPRAYEEGHIPGAVHAHLDRDLSGPITAHSGRHPLPSPGVFRENMGRLGIGPDAQVVAYDDVGGAYAARAWWLLRHYGHDHVAVLDGGIQAWQRAGHELNVGPENNPEALFVGNPGNLPTIAIDSIEKRIPAAHGTLLDARSPDRYRGDDEPIDPVAGHIPGATNAPYEDALTDDLRFRPPNELRQHFEALLGDTAPADAAAYCGSGVTACHLLLALDVAGLSGSALFPGSWSAWCSDDARPVETGKPTQQAPAGDTAPS